MLILMTQMHIIARQTMFSSIYFFIFSAVCVALLQEAEAEAFGIRLLLLRPILCISSLFSPH